ncbi:uncharacterized protein LOC109712796 [Ananas comosus]|uniref:Uncharacterized protein LOC109712796 n=1 Tax=Ananas comosus TaxID=4615 RepID=A0A6P5FFW7_ANACO|nr:uncharacterized protein LOC109712796 [Ananas comosus]
MLDNKRLFWFWFNICELCQLCGYIREIKDDRELRECEDLFADHVAFGFEATPRGGFLAETFRDFSVALPKFIFGVLFLEYSHRILYSSPPVARFVFNVVKLAALLIGYRLLLIAIRLLLMICLLDWPPDCC